MAYITDRLLSFSMSVGSCMPQKSSGLAGSKRDIFNVGLHVWGGGMYGRSPDYPIKWTANHLYNLSCRLAARREHYTSK